MSDSARWQRAKEIFDEAVTCRAEDQPALVHERCGGDRSLLDDVQSLLTADAARGSVFERAIDAGLREHVFTAVATVLDRRRPTLVAGEALGAYEITGFLGAGGMGRVYRARDTTLGREVALKILPDEWLADPDRRARFEREARVLASLNHPNIASIYGVYESPSVTSAPPLKALILELVEGETLAGRIAAAVASTARRGLPVDEAVGIAHQVIDALEAAHERGIVHRDLKPGNIKVTPEGRVKVLDFGLARAALTVESGARIADSPTVTAGATQDGVLLGTAPYMSPEQARGRTVDKRADIWALGCVLYEMLTGAPAFEGDGVADVLANVIKTDPDWTALPDETPTSLRMCLLRCLQKDLRQRFHDVADVRLAMDGAFDPPLTEEFQRRRRQHTRVAYGGALVAAAAVLAALAIVAFLPRNIAEQPETRLEIVTPSAVDPLSLAISPDGRRVVFQGGQDPPRLWLRALDTSEARPLAGTEGGRWPFWSPDSRSVGFNANGQLKRVDLEGGLVRTLAAHASVGGAWNSDGTILMGTGVGPLYVVPADGGTPKPATDLLPGQVSHRWPRFLPDGRRFLLYALGVPGERGLYVGSLAGRALRRISDRESGYQVLPPHVIFARQGALLARRANADFSSLQDGFVPVAPKVLVDRGLFGFAAFSSSSNGSIAYRASAGETRLAWIDRTGRAVGSVGPADDSQLLLSHLSHDGRTAAVTRTIGGNTSVWLFDTERGVPRRLTFGLNDTAIVFSPDGSRIAHQSEGNREGTVVWTRRADGGADQTVLLDEPADYEFDHPRDWSSDGRHLLYSASTTSNTDLMALPLFGDRRPVEIAKTPFAEEQGRFSPDGRWVAYQSNETGRMEIHVQPFPGPGPKFQVSVGGGTLPRWRRDGRELFYLAPDQKLMAVSVTPRLGTIVTSAPRALFTLETTSSYEPAPDGTRFLVTAVVSEASPITVIMNWKPPAR